MSHCALMPHQVTFARLPSPCERRVWRSPQPERWSVVSVISSSMFDRAGRLTSCHQPSNRTSGLPRIGETRVDANRSPVVAATLTGCGQA
jgi:hypothetical protein